MPMTMEEMIKWGQCKNIKISTKSLQSYLQAFLYAIYIPLTILEALSNTHPCTNNVIDPNIKKSVPL